MSQGLGDAEHDLLRQMVRQVLLEVVPTTLGAAAASDGEAVVVDDDAALQAFAARVAALSADPDERAAIVSGRRRFRLAAAAPTGATSATSATMTGADPTRTPQRSTVRVDRGAVTERHVREAEAADAVLHVGRGAVLTPLARDRARASGVEIIKEK
jgi:hypothetical protein